MADYDFSHIEEHLVGDLCDIIAVPTVNNGDPKPGMPFGEDVAAGFDWVRAKAAEFDFDVTEFDGYALQVDIDTGEHVVGVLCHVDVVPAGDGWESNPFEGVVKDGKLFGRGTVDDKGPLVCALYAAKHLRDNGMIPDDSRIRIVVGGDEEVGWEDIKYYTEHAEAPEISFAADGMFPLIFGEKGLIDFDYVWKLERDGASQVRLVSFEGGVARNSVPTNARFELVAAHPENAVRMLEGAARSLGVEAQVSCDGERVEAVVQGKGAHAMFPERGVNAVAGAMALLEALGENLDCHAFAVAFARRVGGDYNGGLFGCACADEASGPLTLNVGKLAVEGDVATAALDIRYPISADFETILGVARDAAEDMGCTLEMAEHLGPIYFKRDDEVVVLLEKAYRDVTGDMESEPFTVGAATFARTMRNTVAFGPIFPGQVEMSHLPNEFIAIEDLDKCTEIYIRALSNLLTRENKG